MASGDPARQKIPGQPPQFVAEIGLVAKPVRAVGVDQTRIGRAAAVMQQPRNHIDVQVLEPREWSVARAPIGLAQALRRDPFPQYRVTHGANAETGKAVDVVLSSLMAALRELAEI